MKNSGKQANLNTRGQTPTANQPQRKVAESAAPTLHKCVVQKKRTSVFGGMGWGR